MANGENTTAILDDALTVCAISVALLINGVTGLFNPIGLEYVLLSALAGTAAFFPACSGFDFISPSRRAEWIKRAIRRSRGWIACAVITATIFIGVFGSGIALAP